MVVYYNGAENAIRSLFRWQSTLTRSVLTGFEFWCVLTLAVTFTLLLDFKVIELPKGWLDISIGPVGAPVLSAAIFTAVFYNSQCYGRYMSLYNGCMQVDTMVKVFVGEMLSNFSFSPELRCYMVASVKYVIAGAFFFHASMDDKEMSAAEWQWFGRKGLLTEKEIMFVRRFPGHTVLLLLHWAQQVAGKAIAHKAVAARYSPPERSGMTNRIYGQVDSISTACRVVSNTLNLPVPFPYFHLLQLLIFFSLLVTGLCCCIYAAQAGAQTYCVAVLPFVVIAFVLLAVRRLAGELSDPFGDDNVDFPQSDFMRHIYDHCAAILNVPERLDPVKNNLVDKVAEFSVDEITTPCCWQIEEAPPEVFTMVKRSNSGEQQQVHFMMHGHRTWKRPEDWDSAKYTAAYVEEAAGEESAVEPGKTAKAEAKGAAAKATIAKTTPASVPAPPAKEPLPPKEPPPPAKDVQLDALVDLENKVGRLLRIVERLPVKIAEALNSQDTEVQKPRASPPSKASKERRQKIERLGSFTASVDSDMDSQKAREVKNGEARKRRDR
mmetsp:Transcript_43640/g.115134  ORF Transcript_43640/g.115134 Transcript_43640/m.115134 type:complete len:550 (-) Transcript_43640:99-1748(-)